MIRPCNEDRLETPHPPLNEVDWIIVEMGRKDGPLSFNPDGFWARVNRHVFCLRVPGSLANHALEALRRFSVRAWYWNLIRLDDLQMMIDAGYSHAQAMEILAHVAGRRGYSPTVEEDPA
jgi:hypothetical protein